MKQLIERKGTNNLEQINAIDIQNVFNKTVGLPLRTDDIDANGTVIV